MSSTPRSDREMGPESQELGALAHALARHARRKKVLGRSLRVTKKSTSKSAASKSAASSGVASSTPVPKTEPKKSAAPWDSPTPKHANGSAPHSSDAKDSVSNDAASDRTVSKRSMVRDPSPPPRAPSHSPAKTAAEVAAQAAAAENLDELRASVSVCRACSLCNTRTQTVFMDGTGGRGVLFVGEAPGADEDRTGIPFVGRSGQLLTDIIEKGMGVPRREVHIANVLKCRPPDNREPTPEEKATCTPWLDRQIELLDPKVIIPLGRHAACHVLGVQAPMGALRQKVHVKGTRRIVPTFHPSYLLRSPGEKKECWKDIQLAMDVLGIPRKGGGTG